ncbi:MAG: FHA domain-containing protein [Vicinamibacterales bacterium]
MALKRCDNGHYFDATKHSSCPSCGVQNIDFGPTKPRRDPAPPPVAGPASDPPKPRAAAPSDAGKTVSLVRKKAGIDPVVGWLVCVQGADRGRDFRIRSERNFIGRAETMDICVPGDDTVSRENHAIVSFNPKNGQFKLLPGEGRGLVYLNGDEVDGPQTLKATDKIELGQTTLMFVPLCGPDFAWE